jgi:hypothetical protein
MLESFHEPIHYRWMMGSFQLFSLRSGGLCGARFSLRWQRLLPPLGWEACSEVTVNSKAQMSTSLWHCKQKSMIRQYRFGLLQK